MQHRLKAESDRPQAGQQHAHLQQPGHEHEKREPVGESRLQTDNQRWIGAVPQMEHARADENHRDMANVQQDRRGRGRRKPPMHLEDPPQKCRPADQQHIRQHDRRQAQRQQPIGPHASIKDHPCKEDCFADERQRQQHRAEQVDARGGKVIGVGWARPTFLRARRVRFNRLCIKRNKRRRERPFPKEFPKQIRNRERNGERRRDQPRPEVVARHDLARQPRDPAHEREQANQLRMGNEGFPGPGLRWRGHPFPNQEDRHSCLSFPFPIQEGRHSCLSFPFPIQEGRHSCLPQDDERRCTRLPNRPAISHDPLKNASTRRANTPALADALTDKNVRPPGRLTDRNVCPPRQTDQCSCPP